MFNNSDVVTEGWYPICPSAELGVGTARSELITHQRVVVWRGSDKVVYALDAFCPHMGADLANGRVKGVNIECYFHQWQYDGTGELKAFRCNEKLPKVKTHAWPVQEAYGHIWVYSAPTAPHPVPTCAGLEGQEVVAWHLGRRTLFAHHHVMMAGGIDLQHFRSVHDLDIAFEMDIDDAADQSADWTLQGPMPTEGWRARLGRWLIGDRFGYIARFAGGSAVGLTYGIEPRFGGTGRPLPSLYLFWGCVARPNGVSDVDIFALTPHVPGLFGWFYARGLLALTIALLAVLKDDDVKAFPYMRFHANQLVAEDKSVGTFMKWTNRLRKSVWSKPT